jgi:hypothetical protein
MAGEIYQLSDAIADGDSLALSKASWCDAANFSDEIPVGMFQFDTE